MFGQTFTTDIIMISLIVLGILLHGSLFCYVPAILRCLHGHYF